MAKSKKAKTKGKKQAPKPKPAEKPKDGQEMKSRGDAVPDLED